MNLKNCPFCGNKAFLNKIHSKGGITAYDVYLASCIICGANIEGVDEGRLARNWNNRTEAFQTALKWPKHQHKMV